MTAWPSNIPDDFERDGYQETLANSMLTTNMDAGPPKRRRRFSADVKKMQGNIVMTDAEVALLETFYYTTIKQVNPFTFTHPRTGVTISVVFTEPPSLVSFAPNYWRVGIKFEVQP